MARTSVDITRFHARIDGMQRATADASAELILSVARETARVLVSVSPKDTRRYARGWAMAARDVGVWSGPLPVLQPSRKREEYLTKLEEQAAYWAREFKKWDGFASMYKRKKRTGEPYYKIITSRSRKAKRRARRSLEELNRAIGNEFAIFFDMESIVQRKQSRSLSTVRVNSPGGHGKAFRVDGRFFVRMTNSEPHARIVERHPHMGHPKATAVAFARAAGLGNANERWIKRLAKASKQAA